MGTFNELYESAEKGELIAIGDGLTTGGICQYHLRRDGQLTIHVLLVLPHCQGQGIGSRLLARVEAVEGASFLLARCPASLPSNAWYARKGFTMARTETTPSGGVLNVWTKAVAGQGPRPKQLELGEPVDETGDRYSPFDLDNHWSV